MVKSVFKRYLLFCGLDYHRPRGGFADFNESFDVLDEAVASGLRYTDGDMNNETWFHIVDGVTGKMVPSSEYPFTDKK